jgi:hypothetical protein
MKVLSMLLASTTMEMVKNVEPVARHQALLGQVHSRLGYSLTHQSSNSVMRAALLSPFQLVVSQQVAQLVAPQLETSHQESSQPVEARVAHAKTQAQIVQGFWNSAQVLHGRSTCQITVQSHAENALLEASHQEASQPVEARVAHAKIQVQIVQVFWISAQVLYGRSTCQITVQSHAENAGDQWLWHCLGALRSREDIWAKQMHLAVSLRLKHVLHALSLV